MIKLFNNKIEMNNLKEDDDHLTIGVSGKVKIKSNKNKERIKCR